MSEPQRTSRGIDPFEKYIREQARGERLRRRRRDARRVNEGRRASPVQYDESGLPVPDRDTSLAARVRRLLIP
jgi:hypothetical protein